CTGWTTRRFSWGRGGEAARVVLWSLRRRLTWSTRFGRNARSDHRLMPPRSVVLRGNLVLPVPAVGEPRECRRGEQCGCADQDQANHEPSVDQPDRETASRDQRAPEIHQQDGLAMAVADLHQPVMQVLLVRVADALSAPGAPDDGEHDIEDRDREHQQWDDDERERSGQFARTRGAWV